MATLEILGELESESNGAWRLGNVNIDEQPEVASALQTKKVPYAVAFVAGQLVPLFEQPYAKEQIALVINKVLELSAQQGVGAPPAEVIEPEEVHWYILYPPETVIEGEPVVADAASNVSA